MTRIDEYPILALGATMTALGLATARPEDILVLESSGCPAPEFAGAFYVGEGAVAPGTQQGIALENELKERDILADGRYHIPALIPVLYQHIKNAGLRCLFWTDTLSIEADGDADSGYEVDFFNASGRQRIKVHKILDTTSAGAAGTVSRRWTEKRLWAMLHGCAGTDASASATAAGIDWKPGRFSNESYLGLRLDAATNWPDARQRLLDAWRKRPAALEETRIAAMATEFHYSYPQESVPVAANWIHRPSSSYSDPLAAFDGGITLAAEEWA